ncbi:hypothetical protein ANO11243_039150 [Dothideomycetidae sp. 11243]|nr:hypothetical protein ANO11243_039150 [fungal sp. No.11243]
MNWVGGGQQRHARPGNTVTKQQKAYFARARNNRHSPGHVRNRGDVYELSAAIGENSIEDDSARLRKARKLAHSPTLDILPESNSQGTEDSEARTDLEAIKLRLLASSDWLGLDTTVDARLGRDGMKDECVPSRHRRKREHLTSGLRAEERSQIGLQNAASKQEEISVRVGTNALVTSPTKGEVCEQSSQRGQTGSIDLTQKDAQGDSQGDAQEDAQENAQEDIILEPHDQGNIVLSQMHRGNSPTSSEISMESNEDLFAQPFPVEDFNHASLLGICSDRQPTIMKRTSVVMQSPEILSAGIQEPHQNICPAPKPQQEKEVRQSSPDSTWKRFIFGTDFSIRDGNRLGLVSRHKTYECNSELSMAARVSSSPSSEQDDQACDRVEKELLERLSTVGHPYRARTRDVIEISSSDSSEGEDSSESGEESESAWTGER